MKPFISVVVPVKKINRNITARLIPALNKQSYANFELILVTDFCKNKLKLPDFVKIVPSGGKKGPADKRDLAVSQSKGELIAFIDDDAYPHSDWLKNALAGFKNRKISAIGGPGITPPGSNWRQKTSGWVWRSWLGAGGAGVYRNWPGKKRLVDDFPTFNLIVRKRDFVKVGGFDSHFWPGEDTKLCYDLVYKLGRKILYSPDVLVFHQRREIFIPHLKQIGRFGVHRGYFARTLPKTSLRLGYFVPSFFTTGLIIGSLLVLFGRWFSLGQWGQYLPLVYFVSLGVYFGLLLLTAGYTVVKEKSIRVGLGLMPAIFFSHLVYGCCFIRGFGCKKLDN